MIKQLDDDISVTGSDAPTDILDHSHLDKSVNSPVSITQELIEGQEVVLSSSSPAQPHSEETDNPCLFADYGRLFLRPLITDLAVLHPYIPWSVYCECAMGDIEP